MVEITKKYKIGTRRFGLINWVGAWTLYQKEVLRFLNVWAQTLFSPLISSLLFLLVLSLAIGAERGDILHCTPQRSFRSLTPDLAFLGVSGGYRPSLFLLRKDA